MLAVDRGFVLLVLSTTALGQPQDLCSFPNLEAVDEGTLVVVVAMGILFSEGSTPER